jgi:hypothetical protein
LAGVVLTVLVLGGRPDDQGDVMQGVIGAISAQCRPII